MTVADLSGAAGRANGDSLAAPAAAQAPQVAKAHLNGLDGIRALAVIGVLAFHAGVSWFGGGLLGVDVFFVLSGYLITSLLIAEWRRAGRIAFTRFYERRARRLLPGLVLMLLLVALYAWRFAGAPDLGSIRADGLSTLAYVANWRFIFSGQNYFVHFGPPSPVLHTWSLAVEEQFYLFWPAVALLALRRGGVRALAWVAAAGVVLSAIATAVLFHVGASSSSLYYGTETRVQEVMAGALLAAALPWVRRRLPALRWMIVPLGLAGGAFLVWAFHAVSGEGPFLYQGGFLVVAGATVAVVALVVAWPAGPANRVLGVGPLAYVGWISYGLYLYHYPLFLMLDNARTGLSGPALLGLRLGVTLAVAVVSYHGVEMPIRDRRVLRGWHLPTAVSVGAAVAVTTLVAVTTVPATPALALSRPRPIHRTSTGHGSAFTRNTPVSKIAMPESSWAFLSTQPALTVAEQSRVERLPVPGPEAAPAGVAAHPRVKVVLLGDSLALTLGMGLSVDAQAWGADFDGQGKLGCDLDPNSTVSLEGVVRPAEPGCSNWPAAWQRYVDQHDPDVVAIELGRWEVLDRLVNGHWTTIGQPAWDHVYTAELSRAIRILSSRGAKVVVFTYPYVQDDTEAPNGQPWPMDLSRRTNAYNRLVRAVVARFPDTASVLDLNHVLDPAGHFASTIDGIPVRTIDDVHISIVGGLVLRPRLLPVLVHDGLEHATVRLVGRLANAAGAQTR